MKNPTALSWDIPLDELSNNESTSQEEPLDEPNKVELIHDQSIFGQLPKELAIDILLKLEIKDFLTILKTDTIRRTLCSENIIRRLLLEKRYKHDLPKNMHGPIEDQAAILDLNMLLMTAASAGYTDDFRILLNTQHILNYILEGARAYAALSTAITSGQVGIAKQLVSHKIIKEQFTQEELKYMIELCEGDKNVKKLIKKKTIKTKAVNKIRSVLGVQC